jgi:ribonuclease-3
MSNNKNLTLFEAKINYTFNNKDLIKKALTHSSAANEQRNPENCNERLEFLGDSVLSIVVSDYLYKNYKELPEGQLTKIRASLVCEKSLCNFSTILGVGEFLYLGRGEENNGGRHRPSILADAFEAIIAAIYLDGGLDEAGKFILRFVRKEIESAHTAFIDYKTTLQEIIQQNPEETLTYNLVDTKGPDHDKSFVVEVHLNSNVIGKGEGHSKKAAEQQAAKEALILMGYFEDGEKA